MDAFIHLVLDVGTIAATIVAFLVLVIMVIAVMDGQPPSHDRDRKATHTDHVEIRKHGDQPRIHHG